ncbi:winged helix-turn-helix transcriptional regulator [Mucilaginibacter sp.]
MELTNVLKDEKDEAQDECNDWIIPVKDALDALHGRWKIPILISVSFGKKRFSQIAAEVSGITDKSLSKELKELEANQLISRTVVESFPPRVDYCITGHGRSLKNVITELRDWGRLHRQTMFGKR